MCRKESWQVSALARQSQSQSVSCNMRCLDHKFTLALLAFLLCLQLGLVSANKRDRVKVRGTTVAPEFVQPEGQPSNSIYTVFRIQYVRFSLFQWLIRVLLITLSTWVNSSFAASTDKERQFVMEGDERDRSSWVLLQRWADLMPWLQVQGPLARTDATSAASDLLYQCHHPVQSLHQPWHLSWLLSSHFWHLLLLLDAPSRQDHGMWFDSGGRWLMDLEV